VSQAAYSIFIDTQRSKTIMGMKEKRLASAKKKAGKQRWTKAEWKVSYQLPRRIVRKQAIFEGKSMT
jgi:predicted 3-demethylubiquinone-9 3-methyltransferase (glyoxalase superfamily)